MLVPNVVLTPTRHLAQGVAQLSWVDGRVKCQRWGYSWPQMECAWAGVGGTQGSGGEGFVLLCRVDRLPSYCIVVKRGQGGVRFTFKPSPMSLGHSR